MNDDRVDNFLNDLDMFLRNLDEDIELMESKGEEELDEGELDEGELYDKSKTKVEISLVDVGRRISGIFIRFEMRKYRIDSLNGNLNNVWLVFQTDVFNRIRDIYHTSHKEILDVISRVIYMKKIRKTVDYIGNNLFNALIYGVTEDNVSSVIKKAYVGFLGNVRPRLLKSVYLSRILKDNGFISELDFAVESYISKPVPTFDSLIETFEDLTYMDNLNSLDISTLQSVVLTYGDTRLVRSKCIKYYDFERSNEVDNSDGVEEELRKSGQWEQMFDVRYDKDSSSDSEY